MGGLKGGADSAKFRIDCMKRLACANAFVDQWPEEITMLAWAPAGVPARNSRQDVGISNNA